MKQLLPLFVVAAMFFAFPSTALAQTDPCQVTSRQNALYFFRGNKDNPQVIEVGETYYLCLLKRNPTTTRIAQVLNVDETGQGAIATFRYFDTGVLQQTFSIDEAGDGGSVELKQGLNGISITATSTGTFTFRTFGTRNVPSPRPQTLPTEAVEFTVVAANLPVNWTKDLSYEPFGENIKLKWSVAEQVDVSGYELERMLEGGSFEKVADVAYRENGSLEVEYSSVVSWPSRSAYYRVKQLDYAGTYDYSNVVFVEGNDDAVQQFRMFPNPASTFVRMSVPEGIRTIDLISASGQVVRSFTANEVRREGMDVSSVSAGLYMVRPVGDNGAATPQRLVVNH